MDRGKNYATYASACELSSNAALVSRALNAWRPLRINIRVFLVRCSLSSIFRFLNFFFFIPLNFRRKFCLKLIEEGYNCEKSHKFRGEVMIQRDIFHQWIENEKRKFYSKYYIFHKHCFVILVKILKLMKLLGKIC